MGIESLLPIAINAGANIIGSALSSGAASDAAQTQADAANNASANSLAASKEAIGLQRDQLDWQKQVYGDLQGNLAPYRDTGTNALAALQNIYKFGTGEQDLAAISDNLKGRYGQAPDISTFRATWGQDPGTAYQMEQGLNAINNSAAARGGRIGGNTLKALQGFGMGIANQDFWKQFGAKTQGYWNNFNQDFNEATGSVNRLQQLAGMGQSAAAGQGAAGLNVGVGPTNAISNILTGTASQVGNNMIGAGNAQAAGTVGSANALSGGLSGAGNNAMLYWLLNKDRGGAGGVTIGDPGLQQNWGDQNFYVPT